MPVTSSTSFKLVLLVLCVCGVELDHRRVFHLTCGTGVPAIRSLLIFASRGQFASKTKVALETNLKPPNSSYRSREGNPRGVNMIRSVEKMFWKWKRKNKAGLLWVDLTVLTVYRLGFPIEFKNVLDSFLVLYYYTLFWSLELNWTVCPWNFQGGIIFVTQYRLCIITEPRNMNRSCWGDITLYSSQTPGVSWSPARSRRARSNPYNRHTDHRHVLIHLSSRALQS